MKFPTPKIPQVSLELTKNFLEKNYDLCSTGLARGAIRTGQRVQLHPSILDKIYDLTGKLEKSQDFAKFEAKHIGFAPVT